MHANQFVTSNREKTHAPHQLGREPIDNKFQVVLLLEKISDVAKKC